MKYADTLHSFQVKPTEDQLGHISLPHQACYTNKNQGNPYARYH